MNPQTYDSTDGRMIHREGRSGQYVRLTDYEALEKRLGDAVEEAMKPRESITLSAEQMEEYFNKEAKVAGLLPISPKAIEGRELIDRPGN